MIKAVIFDLDGTLLNRDASVRAFINCQYELLNQWVGHIPKETYSSRFIELECRGYVWKDKVYQQLVDEFRITGITQEFLLQDYIEHFKQSCIPFPNLIYLLEKLMRKSISIGLITNGKGQFQMDVIEALGIKKYFKTILISEWEGIRKPDPGIFYSALERLNVPAHQSIYVGDHPQNDIQAARNAGLTGVWKRDPLWDHAEADFIIDDLAELLLLIDGFETKRQEMNRI